MSAPAAVFVHYHLRPGGVTRVLEATSAALAGHPHLLLSSTPRPDLPSAGVPDLAYDASSNSRRLLDLLLTEARTRFGDRPLVWHLHNPCLGKSLAVAGLPDLLARSGHRVVLHHHDFAEDGRPALFRRLKDVPALYPVAPHVTHAFLNSGDLHRFLSAGLPPSQAALLPNPLVATTPDVVPSGSPLLFAPIRGIRRKNLGELLLLALAAPPAARFAISRAPENPDAVAVHDAWQRFARDRSMPVDFAVSDRLVPDAGGAPSFKAWLRRSTHFVTTSVAEGFGLPFLEGPAQGRPVIGRRLAHLDPPSALNSSLHLYDALAVPDGWLDLPRLHRDLTAALTDSRERFGKPTTRREIEALLGSLAPLPDTHDFGRLPENHQRQVLDRLIARPDEIQAILAVTRGDTQALPDWLAEALAAPAFPVTGDDLVEFSLPAYRARLLALHDSLFQTETSPVAALDRQRVLDSFLDPARFHPLLA